jgi:hypothetical protein
MTTLAYLKENITIGDIKKIKPYSIGIELHGMKQEDLETLASYLVKCIKDMPIVKEINLNKKYKTRNGRQVKLFYIFNETELDCAYVVKGAILETTGYWDCTSWTITGNYYDNREDLGYDLVEIK